MTNDIERHNHHTSKLCVVVVISAGLIEIGPHVNQLVHVSPSLYFVNPIIMSDFQNVPLGEPWTRWDELDSSSTKWEIGASIPTHDKLVRYWKSLGSVALFSGTMMLFLFLAILSKKETRKNTFNVYLLFTMFPDIFYPISCFLTCIMSAFKESYWSPSMCRYQAWYVMFGFAANAWMNALVSYEIHKLLRSSLIRKRYFPPSIPKVIRSGLVMYFIAAVISTIPLLNLDFILVEPYLQKYACFPSDYDAKSELFSWLVYIPLVFIIPYGVRSFFLCLGWFVMVPE